LPWILSYFITIFWLVGIQNAINWIDGLDGLASSISAISTLGIIFLSLMFGNIDSTFFACAILGANLGFLKYNFRPASIYMGDGGSYLIGFTLASLSITANINSSQVLVPHLSIIILLLPITDMSTVIFKRILSGKSPFFPDKNHIHHRLLAYGLNESRVFYLLCLINLSLLFLALFTFDI
jgi:UDP-N-acetylmuramyl pentapeptide phosphotransferase/UDP-N-acetylglucosamine-1-phosphate transferase